MKKLLFLVNFPVALVFAITPDNTIVRSDNVQHWETEVVKFATVNLTQYAYVADTISPLKEAIYHCTLRNDGSFNTCAKTPKIGAPAWSPFNYTVANINGKAYAYVINGAEGRGMYRCTMHNNGSFDICTEISDTKSLWGVPDGITIATINEIQYAYVASEVRQTVVQCALGHDGTFNFCTKTPLNGAPDWRPTNITFNTINEILYAYVTDRLGGEIYQCLLNGNGNFNSCMKMPKLDSHIGVLPNHIEFATINSTQYAYVFDDNIRHIYKCTLKNKGIFNDCSKLSIPSIAKPLPLNFSIAIVNGTPYAYIPSFISIFIPDAIFQCTFNNDGSFNDCVKITTGIVPSYFP